MRESLHFANKLFGMDKSITGVEVGVDVGDNAACILREWEGNLVKLYLVDPVNNIHDRFRAEGTLVEFINKTSVEASKHFEDNSLDFAYLDGDHSYQGIKDDLEFWYPKVKIGGVICGHDFGKYEGIERATEEFFKLKGMKRYVEFVDFWGVKNA